jgi:hypothetical protein
VGIVVELARAVRTIRALQLIGRFFCVHCGHGDPGVPRRMQLVPARCEECGFVALVGSSDGACLKCGSPVVVVPGASHAETDRLVFNGISEALHANLSAVDATSLLHELEGMGHDSPEQLLRRAAQSVPAIGAFEQAAPASKVVGMLLSILRAKNVSQRAPTPPTPEVLDTSTATQDAQPPHTTVSRQE